MCHWIPPCGKNGTRWHSSMLAEQFWRANSGCEHKWSSGWRNYFWSDLQNIIHWALLEHGAEEQKRKIKAFKSSDPIPSSPLFPWRNTVFSTSSWTVNRTFSWHHQHLCLYFGLFFNYADDGSMQMGNCWTCLFSMKAKFSPSISGKIHLGISPSKLPPRPLKLKESSLPNKHETRRSFYTLPTTYGKVHTFLSRQIYKGSEICQSTWAGSPSLSFLRLSISFSSSNTRALCCSHRPPADGTSRMLSNSLLLQSVQ